MLHAVAAVFFENIVFCIYKYLFRFKSFIFLINPKENIPDIIREEEENGNLCNERYPRSEEAL